MDCRWVMGRSVGGCGFGERPRPWKVAAVVLGVAGGALLGALRSWSWAKYRWRCGTLGLLSLVTVPDRCPVAAELGGFSCYVRGE